MALWRPHELIHLVDVGNYLGLHLLEQWEYATAKPAGNARHEGYDVYFSSAYDILFQ